MSRRDDWREVGGLDAIDAALPTPTAPALPWLRSLRTRAMLGMTPVVAPAVLFVPIGVALGPSFGNVLSAPVLGSLDAVVTIALAVLGIFAGLALDLRERQDRRLFVAASVEALVTMGVVAGAFLFLLPAWDLPIALPAGLLALTLGLCASVSSAGGAEESSPTHGMAVRIADLDDVVPVVVSGVVVVILGSAAPVPLWTALTWLLRTLLLGAAVGTAGWLLFERAHSQAERNLFIAGSAALIGGTSAFLGLSPLLAGLMAGLVWVWLPGHADRVVRTDLRRVQHPLIVVLLLVAGASCEASVQAVWIAAPLVLFRFTGKLMGGWLAMRVQGLVTASELGLQLTAPGLLGIAVALHLAQAVRTQAAVTLLTAVVIATLASEALSLVLRPTDDR
ncbi:MAG: hypothetical protein IT182_11910 [Acidobacteria bacterium]|nr:hypothetical protein [Acidobacteriota bacterium]